MKSKKWLPLILAMITSAAFAVHLPQYLYRTSGRETNLKIRPRPCVNAKGQKGQCMFVWDCIKGEGKHLGACMDRFLFGTCCGHDVMDNALSEATNPSIPLANLNSSLFSPITTMTISLNVSQSTTTKGVPFLQLRTTTTTTTPPSSVVNRTMVEAPLSVFNENLDFAWSASIIKNRTNVSLVTNIEKIGTSNHKNKTGIGEHVLPMAAPLKATMITAPPTTTTTTKRPPTTTTTTTAPPTTATTTTAITTTSTTAPPITWTTTTAPPITWMTTTAPPMSWTTTTAPPMTWTTTAAPPTSTRIRTALSSPTTAPIVPLPVKVSTTVFKDCGLPAKIPEMRIVGGRNTGIGNWPWQVSVRRSTFFGFSSTHRCGGAVLNENWVATAGHCVADLLLAQIRLRIGEYDLSSVSEAYPFVERGVLRRFVHPKYNADTYEYDLALVRLDKPLEAVPNISPICLPRTDDLLTGDTATITGWGRLKEGGTLPSTLQEVQVPIVSNSKCEQMFLAAGRRESIPDFFICAGYSTGGKDSCQGDSGGPLQIKGDDGQWFLAGIISWGIGCGEPNLPGVCTRISKFTEWIFETIEKDGA